ncbi:MAG: hypothetical protein RL885_20640 [Planctomycetota bacterium]
MMGLKERLRPKREESRSDALLESVYRLRWAWMLLALNLAIFVFHVQPAIRENVRVEKVRRALARDLARIRQETKELGAQRRALSTDAYFIQVEARRMRHAPSAKELIQVANGES